MSSIRYDDGKHQVMTAPSPVQQYRASSVETTAFLLVAHTLPWVPVELYATTDLIYGPLIQVSDTMLSPSVGFNIRFTKATMFKTQVSETFFLDSRGHQSLHEISQNNATLLASRLVLVF